MSIANAFLDAAEVMGAGIDALFSDQGAQYSLVMLDMIEVKKQIRESFEDEENTLHDLAESIKARGVLQPILLRPTPTGYELVAGERRFRAAKMAGLDKIPAYIRELTDEEADDAQLAENIHRKNLTQVEEAKKIQRDLDRLGSVEAVLEKHQKSRAWLSKTLSLLSLPEQAKRLVTENVSADVEVINLVKTIEKASPAKAKELVDELKETRGKANARNLAAKAKDEVKPSKIATAAKERDQGGVKALPATAKGVQSESPQAESFSPGDALAGAYFDIFESGKKPAAVLEAMAKADKQAVESHLRVFYDAGKQAKDVGRGVIQGIRKGQFSPDGEGAFALVAFLHGADSGAKFSLLNIMGSVKE